MQFIFNAIIGFIGYRLRGEGADPLNLDTTPARIIYWAVPVGICIFIDTGLWWVGLGAIPLAWVGVAPGYFGGQFDLALQANRNWNNYMRLGFKGMLISTPLLAVSETLFLIGYLPKPIGAVSMLLGLLFPLYYLAGLKLQRFSLPYLNTFTAWGEGLMGAAIMAGYALI